jgi:hypothetical protein
MGAAVLLVLLALSPDAPPKQSSTAHMAANSTVHGLAKMTTSSAWGQTSNLVKVVV